MNEHIQLYIIVPVFNSSAYILEFIEKLQQAILNLKRRNQIEIIFCDDASSDNTVQEIEEAMKNLTVSYKILQASKNIGHHGNTLRGIQTCKINSYCLTIDADMQPSPEVLRSMIPYCFQNNKLLVVGDFKPHDFGMRSIVSFVYKFILSLKTRKNLLGNHGSSLRWFYLNEELKAKLSHDRIELVLMKYYSKIEFYKIDKKYLLNRSQHSFSELVKNVFSTIK